jgi:hypothetical protein
VVHFPADCWLGPQHHGGAIRDSRNNAPNGRALSSEFLMDFAEDYRNHRKGIFRLMYDRFPTHYWAGLITLAKVLKIEIRKPQP